MVGKKILLIGGGGFIGRNVIKYVCEKLIEGHFELIVLSRSFDKALPESRNIKYIIGDYRDVKFLNELFITEKFTDVFHFASSTIPVSSNQNIVIDIHENLVATVNLLEVMKTNNCNFILYLSSGGAVYGEFAQDVLDESHPCEPISSYGVVKYTIEQYIKLYHRQNGLEYLILRISNPYGPFHTSERQGVVNIALRNAIKNSPLTVWGTGEQSKDYIFVEDIAHIIWLLIESNVRNEILNVGSGETLSLNFILDRIKEIMPDFTVNYGESRSSDVIKFSLDTQKLKRLISYKLTPISVGLLKTYEWESGRNN